MKSFRWRIALWFTVSLLGVLAVFMAITYTHLEHELRREKWERAPQGSPAWTLHGTYSDAEVRDIAGELWQLSLVYAIPVALVALLVGYYLATRSLAPVAELNRQLQAIDTGKLRHRVRLEEADTEFRSIERNLNALLTRLEQGFRQLTEFSAQVAHEMRTPLTLLRLQVEEAADRVDPALAESLQDELRRLADYVDECLLLATAEQGRLAVQTVPIDLRALLAELTEVHSLLAREVGRELVVQAPVDVVVTADARHLKQMLHNLLANALRHGVGTIELQVGAHDGAPFCRITNTKRETTPAPDEPGVGLGLRIVRALATAQPNLRFSAEERDGKFIAELRWERPAVPNPDASGRLTASR